MRDFREEDKAQRARLERNSSAGQRADICGILNKVAADDEGRALPGLAAYELLKFARQNHDRHVRGLNARHDRLMAAGKLDRVHPSSPLARAAADRPRDISAAESDDARDQRWVTPLREGETYERLPGADGGMRAEGRTRADHWNGQGGRDLGSGQMAETLRLTVEQMRALAVAQVVASRYF